MKWKNYLDHKKSIIVFYVFGLLAFIWFIIRVIPKPSRAAYPCQRAAFPLASAFIIHLAGMIIGSLLFKRAIRIFRQGRQIGLLLIIPALIVAALAGLGIGINELRADRNTEQYIEVANQPVGIARGVIPGRVVWVWNPEAVNEDCPNTWLEGDNWWMEHNTDRNKVHSMLEFSLCLLSGSDTITEAWDKIFTYFNMEHGKGDIAYQTGEKICIKSNFVSCDAGNMNGHNKVENLNMIDTSPQLMWSVLNQLTNAYGIPQSLIFIGDPSAYFPDQYYNLLKSDFPDVVYISLEDGAQGRTKIESSVDQVLQFSDGSGGDYLPVQFTGADYMINISVAKHHGSSGFTQIAKNHYGSNMRNTASHMHSSLVNAKQGYRNYRHFVDLLGHKDLGGKTILNIADFLWSGHNAWTTPVRYSIAPFSDDYPSSLLVSIDPLALESVGMDFIQTQSWDDQMATTSGVDDYLFQAADPARWPDVVEYDPENDGTILESLGVFEHWNNDDDKQYSGNMGIQGGIELVMAIPHKEIVSPTDFAAEYMNNPGTIVLSWTDLSEAEDAYILERSEGNENNFITIAQPGPDEIIYEDFNVEPNKMYHYRIRTSAWEITTIAESVSVLASSAISIRATLHEQVPFKIFPNPASDEIYITCKQDAVIIRMKLYNMNGILLDQIEPGNPLCRSRYTYDCRNLMHGSYIIQIDTKDDAWTFPLQVVR